MRITTKVAALLLLLALLSLCLYSYYDYERNLPYPALDEVVLDYDSFVGEKISIFGTVTSVAADGSVVATWKSNFTVSPISAKIGDKAEVLGTLGDEYNLFAEKVVVYDNTSYYLIFIRSSIGAVILAFVFLKVWKFDFWRFRFEERD